MRSTAWGYVEKLEHRPKAGACTSLAFCLLIGCAGSVHALGSVDAQPVNASPISEPDLNGDSHSSAPGIPSVYVVDAANTLYSFDAGGNLFKKVQLKASVGDLNGGIAVAMGRVYVTWIKHEDQGGGDAGGVFAFDAATLKQVRLHMGAFTVVGAGGAAGAAGAAGGPGVLHGIAYDTHDGRFYVGSDRLGLLTFDGAGGYIPRTPESTLSVSAIAYDSLQHSLWGIVNRHAVVRFDEQNNAPVPGLPAAGARYRHGQGALAVAYCAAAGGAPDTQSAIAVAFGAPKAGSRVVGAGQTYDTGGKPIGSSYVAKITNPHAISCSSRGEVFVAADNGLLEFTRDGAAIGSTRYSQSLTAPIYGVFAAY